ncbi:MAG TPA: extracellular solute-binding protein [Candidatus Limnocylindrales bacterium]|nr:extracellular solute-binding protein [Candidatus Limnocylindrales bacterium]
MSSSFRPAARGRRRSSRLSLTVLVTVAILLSGCTASGAARSSPSPTGTPSAVTPSLEAGPTAAPSSEPGGTIRLYTSVTQATVDAVVAGYSAAHPGVAVDVFRAPTGELAARIAAEQRDGRILGDVLWLTDPLSIQAYAGQGLLRAWEPAEAAGIDPAYRAETYWGTRFLNMVIVRGSGVIPGPLSWNDLADPAYKDAVAIPDPGFAGSAFGALGYFALSTDAGLDFYSSLKANGAVQVKTPDEVTAGVAEGRFKVGMTLDNSARTAVTKGSPVALVWPTDGAVAMYSPIGVVDATENAATAESFVEFVLSDSGQAAIAGTGWQPIRPSAGGPPAEGRQVYPDWEGAFGRQEELLAGYRAIFGG